MGVQILYLSIRIQCWRRAWQILKHLPIITVRARSIKAKNGEKTADQGILPPSICLSISAGSVSEWGSERTPTKCPHKAVRIGPRPSHSTMVMRDYIHWPVSYPLINNGRILSVHGVTWPTNSPRVVTVDFLGKNRMSFTKVSHKAKVTLVLSWMYYPHKLDVVMPCSKASRVTIVSIVLQLLHYALVAVLAVSWMVSGNLCVNRYAHPWYNATKCM